MKYNDIGKIQILQRILKGENNTGKIYLYGAGERGKIIYNAINDKSVIGGFIDGYKSGYIEDVIINNLDDVKKTINVLDVILVTSMDTNDIVNILESNQIENYLICNMLWHIRFYESIDLDAQPEDIAEFYLIDAFEVFHFSPVIRFLIDNGIKARIVAEPPDINTVGEWFDYDKAIENIKKEGIDFTTKCNPWAKWAITTQQAVCLDKYFGIKINMAYGVTMLKDIFLVSPESCDGFDYKWVHGKFQFQQASRYISTDKMRKIGYPKYLQGWNVRKEIYTFKDNSKGKPVLVYLPTWDECSSIQAFHEQIIDLKKDYYIVSKMHHCTARLQEKENDRMVLRGECDVVLSSEVNFEQFIYSADVVVADAKSGAASEVSFLRPDIRLILLWPFRDVGDNVRDKFIDGIEKFAPILRNTDSIREALNGENKLPSERREIIDEMYEPNSAEPLKSILDIFC